MTVGMVDIGRKDIVPRRATATGTIQLKPETVNALRAGKIKKGDVVTTAQLAGILAAKKTSELIPLCHPIPVTDIQVELHVGERTVGVECTVSASYSTGVEMEALTGAAMSLLTVWDMVKYLEKEDAGEYPETCISDLRVISKKKG
jgi:cyclic pyranopterin phosphate synthase